MSARLDAGLIPTSPDLSIEYILWQHGITSVAGLDEAGRGAWAGPVVAAAVIFSPGFNIPENLKAVRDSKQLSAVKRAELAPLIKNQAYAWGIGFASNIEIDETGILPSTRLAMTRALSQLETVCDHLLIDALFLPENSTPQTALIKGDQRSLSIAAASILAKTARDEWMVALAEKEPEYHFEHHKGYGTRSHQAALSQHGACPQHRLSYKPIKNLK